MARPRSTFLTDEQLSAREQKEDVKYEIRCTKCKEALVVESVRMDGHTVDKAKKTTFYVKPCECESNGKENS